jgi:hypothetical protein
MNTIFGRPASPVAGAADSRTRRQKRTHGWRVEAPRAARARASIALMGRPAASWVAQRALLRTTAGRLLATALALLGIGTAVAMIALWPSGSHGLRSAEGIIVASRDVIPATVTVARGAICPVETRTGCERVEFRLDGGLHPGRRSYLMLPGDEASPRPRPATRSA